MNWEAISAIGEIIGATAVVVTLIYISREIRQNSKAVAISVLRDTTAQWNQWSEMIASSPDLAEIVAKGNRDYENLSDSEALRYGAYIQSFFDNLSSNLALARTHKIYDEHNEVDVLARILSRRIAAPGMTAWWTANTADYDGEFVSWIEEIRQRD